MVRCRVPGCDEWFAVCDPQGGGRVKFVCIGAHIDTCYHAVERCRHFGIRFLAARTSNRLAMRRGEEEEEEEEEEEAAMCHSWRGLFCSLDHRFSSSAVESVEWWIDLSRLVLRPAARAANIECRNHCL